MSKMFVLKLKFSTEMTKKERMVYDLLIVFLWEKVT